MTRFEDNPFFRQCCVQGWEKTKLKYKEQNLGISTIDFKELCEKIVKDWMFEGNQDWDGKHTLYVDRGKPAKAYECQFLCYQILCEMAGGGDGVPAAGGDDVPVRGW